MNPWQELAAAMADTDINVYPAWADQLQAPAIVLMPDDPWIAPHAFGYDQERYVAVAAVQASASREGGVNQLHDLVHHVIDAAISVPGVAWEEVSAPVIDESTGTPFLAARVRLTYRNCAHLIGAP